MADKNEILVSGIVDLTGIDQDINAAIQHVMRLDGIIQQINKNPINIGKVSGLRELKDATDQLVKATKTLTDAINDTVKARKASSRDQLNAAKITTEEAKQSTELAKAKKEEAKAALETARAKQVENKERDNSAKVAAREKKLIDDISNDYKQLSLAYNEAALKAKNMALQWGINHPLAVQALNDAKGLKQILDSVDQATGNYTRNVGNYSSAFNGLNFSMQQIIRETPSLAVNFNQFFLAISNNLPQFFDAINQVKQANIELAASGEKPIPVFQRLLKNLFSLQTGLTIGVTLLTLYGGKIIDWVSSLIQGESALSKLQKQQAIYNEEIRQTSRNLDDFFKYLDRLQQAPKVKLQIDNTNVTALQGMRNELKALGVESQTLSTKMSTAQEDFAKKNEFYNTALKTFLNNASKTAREAFDSGSIEGILDKLSEKDKVMYESVKTTRDAFVQTNNLVADLGTAIEVTQAQTQLKVVEIAKQSGEEQRKIAQDNAVAAAEINKAKNNQILNDERSSLAQRLHALRANLEAEKAIIDANKKFVLSDPTKSSADKNSAVKQAQVATQNAEIAYQEATFDIREQFRVRNLQAEHQMLLQQQQMQAENLKTLSEDTEFSLQDRLSFIQGYADSQRKILDADYNLKKEQAKNTFQTAEEKLAIETDYENKVLKLGIETNKLITESLRSEIEKQQAIREESIDSIQGLFSRIDLNLSSQYSEDVIALNDSLIKKTISYKKYIEERKKLDRQYKKESTNNLIGQLQTELALYDGAERMVIGAEQNIANLREKLRTAGTEEEKVRIAQQIETAKQELENFKGTVETKKKLIKDLNNLQRGSSDNSVGSAGEAEQKRITNVITALGKLSDFFSQVQNLGDTFYDRRIQQIEGEKTALQERYDKEVELINRSNLSQVDRQNRLTEAEKRYAAQKKIIEDKEKAERIKKAQFEKQATIASIILNTAKAIVADLGFPWKIAFDAAIGAAQLAVAIATPIPRFYKGKNLGDVYGTNSWTSTDSYEGPAWVNDGGKREAIIREDGRVELPQKMNMLTWVGAKDIIIPDASKMAWNATASAAGVTYNISNAADLSELRSDIIKSGNNVVRAIKTNNPQKMDVSRELMNAWIQSNKTFKDFFGL